MSYADVIGHRSMAFDETRNRAYEAAIQRVVTRDSVVLDLGAGLGIHGLMAARAGARRVFLIEPESVVHSALDVARRNGFGDRIEAFQGRLEDVTLPEKVDVIISVFTGNLLYSEDLLPSLYLARDRWLKPGGHLIPDRAELMLAPVAAGKLHAEEIQVWSEPHRGYDYSSLRGYAGNSMLSLRGESTKPTLLARAKVIESADFSLASATIIDGSASFDIEKEGACSGLASWIRIHLGDQWLDCGPEDPPVHWSPQLLPVDPELMLEAGSHLLTGVHRRRGGDWTWTVESSTAKFRGSTFLGQPRRLADLQRLAPQYCAVLSEAGRARLDAMGRFTGEHSNEAIAGHLLLTYPTQFASHEAALDLVQRLAQAASS